MSFSPFPVTSSTRRSDDAPLPGACQSRHNVDVGAHAFQTINGPVENQLVPYLPRLSLDWLRTAPGERRRALDGTMAFVDISGFTAMAELLAPLGRMGAEEVTDVMSATFARLLVVAYEHGGGLVKFGGDALLLFFDGERHAEHAAHAAYGMRETLAEIGDLKTSSGPVSLRMHVGVHTGTFDFFLVGSAHRELIVSGAAAARTVQMESQAAPGEILVSRETARALGGGVTGEARGDAFSLLAAPAIPPPGVPSLPDVDGLDLLSCIPEALRAHLAAEKLESEHRRAPVAFVRFSEIGPLLEHGSAAEDAVEEVVVTLQEAARAHGVCFLESDIDAEGGRIVLVAGVPSTSGDDDERLLRTARTAIEANTRLPLHIGIASGDVFAGRIGPPFRRTYTILGSTAALAARLMAKAPARELWTTPDVLARSKTTFSVSKLEPLILKGRAEPVEAVSVGARGRLRTPTAVKLALVDRQRELPVLEASLVPVKMGYGTFVELVGPAGIGKTRILEEVCDRAGGLPVVATACEEYEAATPYFPFRKLLLSVLEVDVSGDGSANSRVLADRLGPLDPDLIQWLPLLGDVLDAPMLQTQGTDDLQPAFRRARLHGVVEEVLGYVLDGPTLLLFEDAHWMDEASCDLLRHLGARVQTKPWLICASRRPASGGFVASEGAPPVPALTLQLDPLPEEDAKALAQAAAPADVSPEELSAITERAGGNPLFVRELVAASGDGARAAGEALPESVEQVVTARIDRLAPPDRALLRWAAVLGTNFSGEFVAKVLEDDPEAGLDSDSWDNLAEFIERDPYSAGLFRFRHALIRDAAYEGLPFRRRRELHGRVAEVLLESSEDTEHAEALSLHFHLAGKAQETWHYSLVAAARARGKYANIEAIGFYLRALAVASSIDDLSTEEIGRAWEALGDALEISGDYAEARRAYEQARDAFANDDEALAGLHLKEGRLREQGGDYPGAIRWYEGGLAHLERLDESRRSPHRVRLSLGYAAARFREGSIDEAVTWAEQAVEEARAEGALAELAHGYYLLHLLYTSVGSPKRTSVRDLALPIYEELGDLLGQANTLNNLGIEAYYEGRWGEALTLYERSRSARQRVGDVVGAATIANNIAEILSDQGRLEEAEEILHEVLETCQAAGSRLMTAAATANLGRAAARAGRHDEAWEALEDALGAFGEIRAGSFVIETRARLAEAALLAGDAERAFTLATAAASTTEGAPAPPVEAMVRRIKGCALYAMGDLAAAAQELEASLAVARAAGVRYELALTLKARCALQPNAAEEAEAAALLDELQVVRLPGLP